MLRANALSFIRLTTDDASRSSTLFDGRTYAAAVTNPAISSHAYRTFSSLDSRGTPGQAASILDGINRKSCIQIARDLGYEVVERDIARTELALADEVFLTGTAAELTPMREIDDIEIGPPGPVTREIQGVFEDALSGRDARYADWLDLVPVPSQA